MADRHRSTLLAFNTVERVFRGDFFHCVDSREVRHLLAEFPPSWLVLGLGTTNRAGRHGEIFIDGTAGIVRFLWADPDLEDAPSLVDLHDQEPLPFVAAAVCDPEGVRHHWALPEGAEVAGWIRDRCEAANIGLAGLRVRGTVAVVAYQVMCHLPLHGSGEGDEPIARQHEANGIAWMAVGMYAANPTVQSVVSHGVAAVHLHGLTSDLLRGGHVNSAIAGPDSFVEVFPLRDLVVRISDLDVAVRDTIG